MPSNSIPEPSAERYPGEQYYIDSCEALDAVIQDIPKLLDVPDLRPESLELRFYAIEALISCLQDAPCLASHQFAIAAALEAIWARAPRIGVKTQGI
jgi:hypothetical protein